MPLRDATSAPDTANTTAAATSKNCTSRNRFAGSIIVDGMTHANIAQPEGLRGAVQNRLGWRAGGPLHSRLIQLDQIPARVGADGDRHRALATRLLREHHAEPL